MADNGKRVFEYQDYQGIRLVTLDSKFTDYNFNFIFGKDGKLMQNRPPVTIKDCRHIDGCVYFHMGHIPETELNEKIELFQKLVREDEGWKETVNHGLIVPDDAIFTFD